MAGSVRVEELTASLVTSGSPWQGVEKHASIGSTNARASELGRLWYVVVADHQSSGRGRLTRSWEAPPGASVAVSATVPLPSAGWASTGWLPLAAGLAVADAMDEVAPSVGARLKWPNDVLLAADGDRKVCGILCEAPHSPSATTPLIVVGAGVNLTQTRAELPVDTATSLALAGLRVDDGLRTRLVSSYLFRLSHWYGVLLEQGGGGVRAAYLERCATIGQKVRVSTPSGEVTGRALDIDDQGRLRLQAHPGGPTTSYAVGDVVHVRPAG